MTLICFVIGIASCNPTDQRLRPNVVIIFLDDAGYSDFNPYNDNELVTPNVQQLADEGVMYTNFHVPQAVCSASRAALITGCNPGRTKVFGAHGPFERGLETNFPTMGEIFKSAGYRTAIFGKWHCGDQPETRPHSRGFEESFGLMYSNDMWKHHPEDPEYWGKYPIKLWKNGEVIVEDVDFEHQKQLTKWYTEHAVEFIKQHKNEPFLLYVPHSMPHVPLFTSKAFEGKSGRGMYGDVLMELDWSVGEINRALKESGVDENTIVIFTSDNGPWISYGNHAGTTPFREAKGTSFEGGTRSACIIKYGDRLRRGSASDRAFFSIDILPTICYLANITLPDTLVMDGKNVWDLISGEKEAVNPNQYYAFSNAENFEGIMSGDGRWKLHLPHPYRTLVSDGRDGIPGKYEIAQIPLSLFDLHSDPLESKNVITEYPEVARRMVDQATKHEEQFYPE